MQEAGEYSKQLSEYYYLSGVFGFVNRCHAESGLVRKPAHFFYEFHLYYEQILEVRERWSKRKRNESLICDDLDTAFQNAYGMTEIFAPKLAQGGHANGNIRST